MASKPVGPADVPAARKCALKLMARRDHCSTELRLKLTQKGFGGATIAAVIAGLEQENMLDERRYIEHFVSYNAGRGHGPERIGRKLRGFALDPQLIASIMESGQDWVARAREVRRKKFGSALPVGRHEILKQAQFLRYRGFSTTHIREALESNTEIDVAA